MNGLGNRSPSRPEASLELRLKEITKSLPLMVKWLWKKSHQTDQSKYTCINNRADEIAMYAHDNRCDTNTKDIKFLWGCLEMNGLEITANIESTITKGISKKIRKEITQNKFPHQSHSILWPHIYSACQKIPKNCSTAYTKIINNLLPTRDFWPLSNVFLTFSGA